MSKSIRCVAGALLLLGLSFGLMAYSEPVPLFLNQCARKISGLAEASVEITRSTFDEQGQVVSATPLTVSLTRSGEIGFSAGGGQAPTPSVLESRVFAVLLSASDPGSFADALRGLGLNMQAKGLQRLNGRVCLVLGTADAELKSPQFWMDKFAGTPARLIFSLNVEGRELQAEARFGEWAATSGHGLFPSRVEFFVDGRPWLRYDARGLKKASGTR